MGTDQITSKKNSDLLKENYHFSADILSVFLGRCTCDIKDNKVNLSGIIFSTFLKSSECTHSAHLS